MDVNVRRNPTEAKAGPGSVVACVRDPFGPRSKAELCQMDTGTSREPETRGRAMAGGRATCHRRRFTRNGLVEPRGSADDSASRRWLRIAAVGRVDSEVNRLKIGRASRVVGARASPRERPVDVQDHGNSRAVAARVRRNLERSDAGRVRKTSGLRLRFACPRLPGPGPSPAPRLRPKAVPGNAQRIRSSRPRAPLAGGSRGSVPSKHTRRRSAKGTPRQSVVSSPGCRRVVVDDGLRDAHLFGGEEDTEVTGGVRRSRFG
ncbi:MAG: hypothetical protein CM1200mP2_51380 [Planctomycetaceae bacterium]|nr:MAG: hypothetical protein CM1200mP2_51380 [Planctomycetaceae bacterium]